MTEQEYQQLLANQRAAAPQAISAPTAAPEPDNRPEAAIQEECVQLLVEDGWRALRTDPVSDRGRAKGFGEPGMADYLLLRYGRCWDYAGGEILWIEFKSSRGKPAKHQIAWHTRERARGAMTLVAGVDFPASVAGFREWYADSGLMRRARWW